MEAVLVLNADYTLLEIVSWKKAMSLIFREKVRLVEEYAGRVIRSAHLTFAFPAVVVRIKYVQPRKRIRFSRKNILARDLYTCQYCNARPRKKNGAPDLEILTIDHVVPRALSRDGWVVLPWNKMKVRVTSWRNIVTACEPCNSRKADLSLRKSGLTLRKRPRVPTAIDVAWMSLFKYEIPNEWQFYLPGGEANPWRGYWDAELSSD